MTRLGDDTLVHAGDLAAFTFMVELVKELQKLKTEAEARAALRAFIAVRRRHQPRYLARDRPPSSSAALAANSVQFVEHAVGAPGLGRRVCNPSFRIAAKACRLLLVSEVVIGLGPGVLK
jgi:hypothetical protein